jgi:NAD(P)-dependent dehydrogenase (short-subunit alcohol dehydrogenase family)
MQRTEMVALVTGAAVGLGGGGVGAFLVCTAGRVVVHHFLDQLDDQYVEFRQPAQPTARRGAHLASLAGALVMQPAGDQFPRMLPIA